MKGSKKQAKSGEWRMYDQVPMREPSRKVGGPCFKVNILNFKFFKSLREVFSCQCSFACVHCAAQHHTLSRVTNKSTHLGTNEVDFS